MPRISLPPEMDEHPSEIVGVLFHPMVELLHLLRVQEAEHPLFQLARSLAGDDLHQGRLLGNGLVDDVPQGLVDVRAAVVDVVQVEFELHQVTPV